MVYVCDTQVVSHAIQYHGHNIEAIKLVLEHGMNKLCVIVIYSGPQTQATKLYTTLYEILIECDNVPVIIIGDFNIQTPKDNTDPLCNYMKAVYKCNQYLNESTTKYNTTIDLVFVKFIKSFCWHNRLLLVRSQNGIYCYIISLTDCNESQTNVHEFGLHH